MKKMNGSEFSSDAFFNTFASGGTNKNSLNSDKPNIWVFGEGTERNNNQLLKNRAKRKIIDQKLMLSLIDIAKEKGAMDRVNSYWNTYYCQTKLYSSNGRIHSNHCKNRFCSICCGIRKMTLIKRYYPVLKNWEGSRFVSLTRESVKAHELYDYVRLFKKKFSQVLDLLNKRHYRLKEGEKRELDWGIKPIGLYSLECNFNPIKQTYNPHFHIIVPNLEISNWLIWEWRKKWKKGETNLWAQQAKMIRDTEFQMIETIKYGAKIFTAPDMKKKSKLAPMVYAAALDNIHAAFDGVHLLGSFGFELPKEEKRVKPDGKVLEEYDQWLYDAKLHDWVNEETGEVLSGYQMNGELETILENNINVDLV